MNWIDLGAILPWYIAQMLGFQSAGTGMLRVLRLSRILRVVRVGGRSEKITVVWTSLAGNSDLLVLIFLLLSMCVLVFSTLMYFVERGEYDAELGYYTREGGRVGQIVSI